MPRARRRSDKALLEQWFTGGDTNAFEEYRKRHRPKVMTFLSEFVKTPDRLADEVFDRLAKLDKCPRQPLKKLRKIQREVLAQHLVANPQDAKPQESLTTYKITNGLFARNEKRERQSICALCGEPAEVTREHFVPRCLWSGPLPNRMETVPACDRCNAGSNLDDEHFRNALVMMFDQEHPEKKKLINGAVRRSLEMHPGWVADMLRQVKIQPLMSTAGLWLGDYPTLPLDGERFTRSLFKIVKGLFYLIRKHPFPADGQIGVIGELCADTKPLIDTIEENLSPTFDFGDDVFEWRFGQTKDGITMWKLAFYRSVVFYAIGFEKAEDWQALTGLNKGPE
jgi:hypothetical protein